ncbi:MAG: trigger factor [Deltaproteobacteria bacterium]|nr:trigger factor [Deltaproteobacteria bacterium]
MSEFPIKVEVEHLSDIKRRLDIVVSGREVTQAVEQAYRDLGKRAKVKGFRPGKIPRSVLELYYKKQVDAEVSDILVRRSLREALREKSLTAVELDWPEPLPQVVEGQEYRFIVDLEVPPDFNLAENYRDHTLEDPGAEVAEEEVDARLEEVRQNNALVQPVTEPRGIAPGDFVVLSYQGYFAGQALAEAKGENVYLEVGAGKFNPDFERQLLGLATGAESRFAVHLPANFFNPLLADKVIEFMVIIHEIKEKVVPDLDDALAQNLGGNFADLADLRRQVREDIIRRKERERQEHLERQVMDRLLAAHSFEVPPALVKQEQERLLADQMYRMQAHGLSVAGMDKEKLLEALKPAAERRVRGGLIMDRLAAREGIAVEDAELDAALARIAVTRGQEVTQVRQFYQEHHLMEGLRRQLRDGKVIKSLLDQATLIPTAAVPAEEKA